MLIFLLNCLFSLQTFDFRVEQEHFCREMFGGEGVRYQNNEYGSSTLFLNTVLQASLSCRFLLHFYSCIHDDPIKAS